MKPIHSKDPVPAGIGIPKAIKKMVFVEEWNDFEGVEKTFKKHNKEIGAIICEPVAANMTVIPAEHGFLKHLRELCDKYDVALIFDEVKTGFRLAPGGAQEIYGVKPDMATFAKSVANGYPMGVVAGKKEMMSLVGKGEGKVRHGGTYSGNPISMAAANATLTELQRKEVFEHLNDYGRKLINEIRKIYEENKVEAIVQGFPTMFQSLFTEKDRIKNCRERNKCDLAFFGLLQRELMKEGVMIDEDFEEATYTSYSHKKPELEKTISCYRKVVEKVVKLKKNSVFKRVEK